MRFRQVAYQRRLLVWAARTIGSMAAHWNQNLNGRLARLAAVGPVKNGQI